MAMSTVRALATLVSLALFVVGSAVGQSVEPSNTTLPAQAANSITQLRVGGGLLSAQSSFGIAPLTSQVGFGESPTTVAAITANGTLKLVDPSTISNLTSKDIAYISCDPNDSNTTPTTIVGLAGNVRPQAIVLFSLTSTECLLQGIYGYTTIFTMTSAADSSVLSMSISLYPPGSNSLSARIGTNSSATGQGQGSSNNEGGPAPTTAVAMSILYSITGIITLLFLVIIATGAIRAHRHPERYGPRSGFAGRPRQSRAKGLARAMLETIPIVKFGDPEPDKPANQDVELEAQTVHPSPDVAPTQQHGTTGVTPAPADPEVMESGMGPAQEERSSSPQEALPKEGELGCSICTEDFTTGEDVRVLPCNHKYHPACIDPWLLNVSGTCPLCRHDLRPETSHTSDTATTTTDLPPPLTATEGASPTDATAAAIEDPNAANPQRRARISRFLDLNRLRHAPPDERIAALRRLREHSQREGEAATAEDANGPGVSDAEERGRGARLTGRLRDVFRIRTRTAEATDPVDAAGGQSAGAGAGANAGASASSGRGRRTVYRF